MEVNIYIRLHYTVECNIGGGLECWGFLYSQVDMAQGVVAVATMVQGDIKPCIFMVSYLTLIN